ncbi:MAG: DUF5343 domain-containing protein [Candidatus Thiodiazotropha taylori]
MSDEANLPTPAYATYKSFSNLINDLREDSIPPHIVYSVVKGSNSGKATMLASLKALQLIDDEKCPTDTFKTLISEKENYKTNLRGVLQNAYPYLFDGSIDLSNTTTEMVAEKFKEAGASGSTIAKGMAFFLNAAKEAGIGISARVRPPQAPKSPSGKRRASKSNNDQTDRNQANEPQDDQPPTGTEKISFTLRGMPDVSVYFPEGLEDEDEIRRVIKATVFNLEMYYGVKLE